MKPDQKHLPVERRPQRLLVLGAGAGTPLVLGIAALDPLFQVIGLVDEDTSLRHQKVLGYPVLGTLADLGKLWKYRTFDGAVVSQSSSPRERKQLFDAAKALDIPFFNLRAQDAQVHPGAWLGEGNVIGPGVRIREACSIGDNNFLGPFTFLGASNRWESHSTVGPRSHFGDRVTMGECVKVGAAARIPENLTVGSECLICAGAVVKESLPAKHALKNRIRPERLPLI